MLSWIDVCAFLQVREDALGFYFQHNKDTICHIETSLILEIWTLLYELFRIIFLQLVFWS